MAVVDPTDQSIVVRVVYDGPPEAGKTTSVRALARGFNREVYTPEERDGRTVYFDWFEYQGGRFDGAPIRCHVASVPGQDHWRRRRMQLVDQADVVVFVGDTSSVGWSESVAKLNGLLARLKRRKGPPVGVVFQANRRDVADAVPLSVVRAEIPAENVAIIESVATDGSGVRETFVFAIRLALDRVREEQRRGLLPSHQLGPGADEMLDILRSLDDEPASSAAPEPPLHLVTSTPAADVDAPRVPSAEIPSGLVWPPIEGRIALRECARVGVQAQSEPGGDFAADLAHDWHAHSAAADTYEDVDDGRRGLIAWARTHATAHFLLSRQRCIALADTGRGAWRLWQLVRRQPSLRDIFNARAAKADPSAIARLVSETLSSLTQARAIAGATALPLSCTLDTIGVPDGDGPRYVGLIPSASIGEHTPDTDDHIADDLAQLLAERPANLLPRVRDAVARSRGLGPTESGIRDALLERLASAAGGLA